MMTEALNWSAIAADPRFKELQQKKSRFLWRLFIIGVAYYFMLPIGAAWFSDIFKIKVWGAINLGLVFALSEFIVAWGIAACYARKAGAFDLMAEAIVEDAWKIGAQK